MKKIFLILCLGFFGSTASKAQLVGSSPCLNAFPSAPSQVIFTAQPVTLTANIAPAGFTYRWYDSDQVTFLSGSQVLEILSVSESKTYYLAYYHTSSGCLSTLVPVRVNRYAENRNWVRTYTSRDSITSDVTLRSGTQSQVMKSTEYYDSLGRLNQKVAVQASVNGWDIITPVVYDSYGRQYRDYLPFANNSTSVGLFRSTATSLHSTYYSGVHGDTRGYGDKTYEASPLNRVTKQGVPGTPWIGKEILLTDATNTSTDAVRIWTVNSSGFPVTSATYPLGALSKLETTDENGQKVQEYKDKLGRIILKKVQGSDTPSVGHSGWLCTYYVYDDLGQLRVVIQPHAVNIFEANNVWYISTDSGLAFGNYFRYTYDQRGRMTTRWKPGSDVEYFIYDPQDRLIGYEDPVLRGQQKYLYTKYDALGRKIMTGLTAYIFSMEYLQAEINAAGSNNAVMNGNGTVSEGWPADTGEILSYYYYDGYQNLSGFNYGANTGFDVASSTRTHGLPTGKKVKNLDSGNFYTSAYFYDEKGRVIQTVSDHQLGGVLRTSTKYNFENQPTQLLTANSNAAGHEVLRTFNYNAAGLLATTTHKIGSQAAKTIAQNTYNDLGQVTTKAFPEITNGNQTYSYNIRGWLKTLGSTLLGVYKQVNYYETSATVNNWNGNISRVDWIGQDAKVRTYNYTYDPASRLKNAFYTALGENDWFNVKDIGYDASGNIQRMKRNNQRTASTYGEVDNLNYEYWIGRLVRVSDSQSALSYTSKDFKDRSAQEDYGYNTNGNLTRNLDKDITHISYYYNNLPKEVVFTSGGMIKFAYDAEGVKLTQKVYNSSGALTKTQDYIGEFVYLNGALDYLIHEEGRVASEPSGLFYEYYIKDHLGNVRQVLRNPTPNARIATMEQDNAEEEESQFTQIKPTRRNEPKHNVTRGGKDVAWLNADRGEMVGPGTSQEIFEGDSVVLSVHGKYLDRKKSKVNPASFAASGGKTALLDQLNELALNTSRAGGTNPIALLNLVDILAKDLQKKEVPEAYLIYALYDEDSNRYEVGKKVLTRNAANQHEELGEKLAIKKNGYIETFVVNETGQDVWFDNFRVLSTGSLLVQETHYDPWGLELTGIGYEYLGVKKNPYLYNGKELIEDNGLQYYDYGARMYDPAIGRFHTIDPKTEIYNSWSPYLYAANNPIRFEDTNGEGPGDKVLGFLVAFVDNVLGGFTPLRQIASRYVSEGGGADYNGGLDMGDAASMGAGLGMIDGGSAVAAGGTAVLVGTAGTTAPVSGSAAVIGTAVAVEGVILGTAGANNLASQKGRVNAEGKTNPKREAREKATENRNQQPASEDYAKYKAKELEKSKGKDARREAHDKKESGTGDRTKKQLDEDYNKGNN